MHLIRSSLAVLTAALLAACATQPPEHPGRHMTLHDLSGKLLMQFDYPTDELCAKTSAAMHGTIYKSACAETSIAAPLATHTTLRYTPPGVLVQGHYLDMDMCNRMTAQLSAGVQLIQACSAK